MRSLSLHGESACSDFDFRFRGHLHRPLPLDPELFATINSSVCTGNVAETRRTRLLQGVIYRDVKADNFLFLNDSHDSPLKATDFGLAIRFRLQLSTFHHYLSLTVPHVPVDGFTRLIMFSWTYFGQCCLTVNASPCVDRLIAVLRASFAYLCLSACNSRHWPQEGNLKSRSGTPAYMVCPGSLEADLLCNLHPSPLVHATHSGVAPGRRPRSSCRTTTKSVIYGALGCSCIRCSQASFPSGIICGPRSCRRCDGSLVMVLCRAFPRGPTDCDYWWAVARSGNRSLSTGSISTPRSLRGLAARKLGTCFGSCSSGIQSRG